MTTFKFSGFYYSKCLILPIFLFTLCIACNQNSDKGVLTEENPDMNPIEGVWKLSNQYWVKDGDTLYLGPEEIPIKQKIYLDGYVIWTSEVPHDTSEWHGFGTYSLSSNILNEKLISMSLLMKEKMGSEDEVIYQIELDDTFCKQSTNSIHRGIIHLLVEEWQKLN